MSSAQYKRKIDSGDDPKEQHLAQLKIENGESLSVNNNPIKKKRSRLEKVLLALVLVLTVLCIVFIVLYATKSKTGTGDTNGTNSGSQGGGTGGNTQGNSTCNTTSSSTNICTSADCVTVASGVLKSMDQSVKPCDDFYQYACGGWMKNNPIPDGQPRWSRFSELSQRNDEFMRKLITSEETRKNFTDNEAVMKAFRYYDACMNEDEIESLGGKPLIKVITEHGAWSVANTSWNASSWNFMENFVKIQKHLSVSPLFRMKVDTDRKNSTRNIITIDQPSTELPREVFLLNSPYHIKVRIAYRKLMDDVVNLLYSRKNSSILMQEVYEFEKALAQITTSRQGINTLDNRMTIRELVKRVGNKSIDWFYFFKEMFKETGHIITLDEPLVVYAEGYLKRMSYLFEKTDKRTVANYIMWQVVRYYASALSKPFRDAYLKYKQELYGTKSEMPRWQTCVVSVTDALGMAMGLLFVEQKFTSVTKTSMEGMIHGIREVFIENLKTFDWIDEETRKASKEKAEAILEDIGYPDFLANKTALVQTYDGFNVDNKTYFVNLLQKYNFTNTLSYAQIDKPVDRLKWFVPPPVVNAYYSPTTNRIVFPAGILQDPFYDHIFPKSLNYGGIGMVIGHEITHGFDNNGREFNKEGNLVKWWTDASIANFEKKTECLVDQYGTYSMFGKKLNGRRTLGENIADNGGIKQSYQAYQNWVAKHGEEAPLPGLNLTHNQLFFVSFAQLWCSSVTERSAINQIENWVHSLERYRVIGSLSNSEEFSEAFKCGPDTPMNVKKKCSVW